MHGDFESLLFGLFFLAVVLFHLIKQFLAARAQQRRRQQQAQRSRQVSMPQAEPVPLDLTENDWGRAPEPATPAPLTPAAAPVPREVQQALRPVASLQPDEAPQRRTSAAPLPRRARHRLFHSQRALRNGVVMMTVLGPCRALQPYDNDH